MGIHICWLPSLGIERLAGRDEGGRPNAETGVDDDSMVDYEVRDR